MQSPRSLQMDLPDDVFGDPVSSAKISKALDTYYDEANKRFRDQFGDHAGNLCDSLDQLFLEVCERSGGSSMSPSSVRIMMAAMSRMMSYLITIAVSNDIPIDDVVQEASKHGIDDVVDMQKFVVEVLGFNVKN